VRTAIFVVLSKVEGDRGGRRDVSSRVFQVES
jgi:hypothetical protein